MAARKERRQWILPRVTYVMNRGVARMRLVETGGIFEAPKDGALRKSTVIQSGRGLERRGFLKGGRRLGVLPKLLVWIGSALTDLLTPRVECPVDLLQVSPVEVGVELGGGDAGVAEHLLDGPQVCPALQ